MSYADVHLLIGLNLDLSFQIVIACLSTDRLLHVPKFGLAWLAVLQLPGVDFFVVSGLRSLSNIRHESC